jgi:hypothetical protein
MQLLGGTLTNCTKLKLGFPLRRLQVLQYDGEFYDALILAEMDKPSELSAEPAGLVTCADVLLVFRVPSSYRGVMDDIRYTRNITHTETLRGR